LTVGCSEQEKKPPWAISSHTSTLLDLIGACHVTEAEAILLQSCSCACIETLGTRTQQRCRWHFYMSQGCFVTGERPRALLPNGTPHIHTLKLRPRQNISMNKQ